MKHTIGEISQAPLDPREGIVYQGCGLPRPGGAEKGAGRPKPTLGKPCLLTTLPSRIHSKMSLLTNFLYLHTILLRSLDICGDKFNKNQKF